MTKFITYYNLCPIHDPKEFLGISFDRDEDNIITTLSRNIIIILKISTQKQIRSWSVLEKLSCKVVYDRRSEKYVGVFANSVLRCWDDKTTDLNKCKKIKFHRSIADLVSTAEGVWVLYTDGTCELLADAIQSRKEEFNSSSLEFTANQRITDTSVMRLKDGQQVLTYFQHRNNGAVLEVVRQTLQDGAQPIRVAITRDNADVKILGYAVVEADNVPMVITIWSDRRVFQLKLTESVTPDESPGYFVSIIADIKTDGPVSIVGISQHFIAIYGASNSMEGASLLLYNTQFKVVKAKQFFKVYFEFSHLWAMEDHILLAMGQNLSVVSYRMSKELLAELVGAQINNCFQAPVEGDQINEEEPLQDCLSYTSEQPSRRDNVEDAYGIPVGGHKWADGNTIPFESVDLFNKSLNLLCKHQMHTEIVEHDMHYPQVVLMSNCKDDALFSRDVQIIAQQMERCGASEHEITEKLLTGLIEANLLQDIRVCVRRYTNISEKILVKVLRYVLGRIASEGIKSGMPCDGEPGVAAVQQGVAPSDGECEFSATELPNADILAQADPTERQANHELIELLNLVLACSFDESTIAIHIRRDLDYTAVLFLLEHLLDMVVGAGRGFEERPAAAAEDCIDFELQAIRWFGILLNTHFQKLALARDVHLTDILCKWNELFAHYKHEVRQLQQVAALLYSIVQRKKLTREKNYSKWYFIEEVNLY